MREVMRDEAGLRDVLRRLSALEKLADQQGWVLQPDGTWVTRATLAERERMEQLCRECQRKEKDCECDFCMGCGSKTCDGDCRSLF